MDKREFILMAKAFGSARTVAQLAGDYDTLVATVPAPAPAAVDTAGISDSNAVSAWLAVLRDGSEAQRAQFDTLRLAPYTDQHAAWTAAGKP